MKVLITGENGYIGNKLTEFLSALEFEVNRLSLKNSFTENQFIGFDVVVHTAALVHKKESRGSWEDYYKVNTKLTYELALKCKNSQVKHFIFISTMAVFGSGGFINSNTVPSPKSFYGRSKLLAEQEIMELCGEDFKVTIIRPPMVYGKNAPGNFKRLAKLAKYTIFFPKCINNRSMIYIEHLLKFIKIIIDNKITGTFHPQNKEYVCTSDMVRLIRKAYGKKTLLVPGFNFLSSFRVPVVEKLFSNMAYSKDIDNFNYPYCEKEFEETVYLSL